MLREAFYCKKAVSDLLLVIYVLGRKMYWLPSLQTQPVLCPGASFLGEDFVFAPVEFHKVPMCLFLWPVCVPLNGIPEQGVYQ